MTTPELLRPIRTEDQARSDIAANDRRGWFPGTRALGAYGVMSGKDGREVARCAARYDSDQIVAMARAFDDMKAALAVLAGIPIEALDSRGQRPDSYPLMGWNDHNLTFGHVRAARDALLKANAVRP